MKTFFKIKLIFVLLFLLSCDNEIVEYYENGNIKRIYYKQNNLLHGKVLEYYEERNKMKSIKYFNHGKLIDSAIYFNRVGKIEQIDFYKKASDTIYVKYFENGILNSEGNFHNNKKINIWKHYHENGYLKSKFEYIDSCGTQYTNQGWVFNQKGDTLFDKSNYYKIKNYKKYYQKNELIQINVEYNSLFQKSTYYIVMSNKIENDYCNFNEVDCNILIPNNGIFNINVTFSKKGFQNLRGMIVERTNINKKEANRVLFFNIPIQIK